MADIIIIEEASNIEKGHFLSAHKPTVKHVLDSIGNGVLTKFDDKVIYANPIVELVPGTYKWKEQESALPQKESIHEEELRALISCSTLSEELLTDSGLNEYVTAAHAAYSDTKPILENLVSLQDRDGRDSSGMWCNSFACVLLSSGTGKTQLAATSAVGDTLPNVKTIYLCLEESDPASTQKFYVPHQELTRRLRFSLSEFMDAFTSPSDSDFAASILKASRAGTMNGGSLLPNILSMILFGSTAYKNLDNLRNAVFQSEVKFLVFIDEVPPCGNSQQDKAFALAMLLRDVLRAIGIAPILMGTHIGAENAAGSITSRSSVTGDEEPPWVTIVSSLPKYKLSGSNPCYLLETDRPLVLHWTISYVSENSGNGSDFSKIIAHIRHLLQRAKPSAWQIRNGCQLLQLFRLEQISEEQFDNTHSLLGGHFGNLAMENFRSFTRSESRDAMKEAQMTLVSPKKEPLLHLALVTWDCSMLGSAKQGNYFPLARAGQAVSARRAFNLNNRRFKFSATIENPPSKKLCGDKLEVLVHATLSLASMKVVEDQFLPGVPLIDFVTCTAVLLQDQDLNKNAFNVNSGFWAAVLRSDRFVDMKIPALGSCDSPLHDSLKNIGVKTGRFTRPADLAGVHGQASCGEVNLFQVECKNHTEGVDKGLLTEFFCRIKPEFDVAFIFVSSLKGRPFSQSEWKKERRNKDLKHSAFQQDKASIAVLTASADTTIKHEWMKTKNFAVHRGKETKLLIVIFVVGKVV